MGAGARFAALRACGCPGVVRLADGQLPCVFHTDFVDGDCEIRAVRPREVE